ncbi:MAG TPA: hypothetical protein VFB38_17765 [Chthonomonadaceae bacterium]|nr:hypothetical protein [Chthonomonadaceae bacterium]
MKSLKTLLYVGLPSAALTLSLWTAVALQKPKAPPPMGHPHMQVAPGARRLHSELERVSQAAARKGQYTCCINPPCEFCAVHMAMCPCGKNLAAGKAVCRECKGGWDVGEGRIPGVNAAEVKGMSAQQVASMMKGHMGGGHRAPHRAAGPGGRHR